MLKALLVGLLRPRHCFLCDDVHDRPAMLLGTIDHQECERCGVIVVADRGAWRYPAGELRPMPGLLGRLLFESVEGRLRARAPVKPEELAEVGPVAVRTPKQVAGFGPQGVDGFR